VVDVPAERRVDPTALIDCVTRAQRGCPLAFAQIHGWYGPLVTHVVRRRVGALDDVADLVQETFLRAWTHLGAVRDPACIGGWLCQIARHVVTDHGRAARARPHLVVLDGESGGEVSPCPSVTIEQRDALDRVWRAVGTLSSRDAQVIALAVRHESASEPIADSLGIATGHAKVVLHRARQRLRDAVA
jgi:RNA polymerase sigma-70 factor (ECF subfamily)